jgi:hypothetical protein
MHRERERRNGGVGIGVVEGEYIESPYIAISRRGVSRVLKVGRGHHRRGAVYGRESIQVHDKPLS